MITYHRTFLTFTEYLQHGHRVFTAWSHSVFTESLHLYHSQCFTKLYSILNKNLNDNNRYVQSVIQTSCYFLLTLVNLTWPCPSNSLKANIAKNYFLIFIVPNLQVISIPVQSIAYCVKKNIPLSICAY